MMQPNKNCPFRKETNKTLQELDLVNRMVNSVDPTERVYTLLAKMKYSSPRLSAIPVIDADGKLIANFSASVLKGLQRSQVLELSLPVVEFLKRQPVKAPSLRVKLGYAKSLYPIAVTADTTLEIAVLKMIAYKIHRLWCVDNDGKLVGLVTISDLMRALMPYEKLMEEMNCFIV